MESVRTVVYKLDLLETNRTPCAPLSIRRSTKPGDRVLEAIEIVVDPSTLVIFG
jgi:hypothetical protein